jgi:hypothetical protein
MHTSSIVTWLSLITCSYSSVSQIPVVAHDLGALISPCLSGLDLENNSCLAASAATNQTITSPSPPSSLDLELGEKDEEDECLSDDCPTSFKSHKTHGIWTHPPKCISSPTDSSEEFCVYTNSSFFRGRGVSIFTSPKTAKVLETISAFSQANVHDDVDEEAERPYEIRYVEGRGNGLFATRELKRGDLILTDLPVGVYHSDAFRRKLVMDVS